MTVSTTTALFSPTKIGAVNLQHRVVLCPLTRLRCNNKLEPVEMVQTYYEQRATEGGLLISEATLISPTAGAFPFYPPGMYTQAQVAGWRRITEAVHKKGAFMFCQLWHAGRSAASSMLPNNVLPAAPSPVAIKTGKNYAGEDYEVPHALTEDEIQGVIQDFVNAAKLAMEAGFDGIEIHGANG